MREKERKGQVDPLLYTHTLQITCFFSPPGGDEGVCDRPDAAGGESVGSEQANVRDLNGAKLGKITLERVPGGSQGTWLGPGQFNCSKKIK